ncbi:NAD-dependent malic enzyme [Paenilisteria rocourtiae]|uniref:NAD-dependent malic enzyme n=1 Tax=Listeria rocourtiae TaxID=647910 RepID=A0A4R6ZRK4_9LIST|nr:NAD-dependent malic enzyme [Listeria rocourtiae]EUJ52385.1 malate dehydrogenase [Listeria rocourtiae FSL F6-920]MBC1603415.1 NAD-dependent malic enzyme [Listeria rocourtiae]TDR55300.1 NAD-dependent malic enzyme [Listeria rocourtiae]
MMNGYTRLHDPLQNKGTAFTIAERKKWRLDGLIPATIETIDQQAARAYEALHTKTTPLEKHLFLMALYNENRTLFYKVVIDHVTELMPIIYTPTIGDAVMHYHKNWENPQDALFLQADSTLDLVAIFNNNVPNRDNIKMIVVTDGEGILGIGDWGLNGVSIAIGKLAVYTVAAGLAPDCVLPIVIDAGTNNKALREDSRYLGNKSPRLKVTAYDAFIARFVDAVKVCFPKAVLHWEDFGRDNASRILEMYREQLCTFNDDIQGTGAMVVSAALATTRVSQMPLSEQRIVIFGAGTAGIGIADQLVAEMMVNEGLTAEQAKSRFYLVDRPGLLTSDLPDLTSGQRKYARDAGQFSEQLTHLQSIVQHVKPTMLIGCSGVTGAFSEEIVLEMSRHVDRPAILPLSNPTRLAEATAHDLITWTKGSALVVTGSPSEPVLYDGNTYFIGQANNALLYPGLGLAAVITEAREITNDMLAAASHAVATQVQDIHTIGAALLPSVATLRETSHAVTLAVVEKTIELGLNRRTISNPLEAVNDAIWIPEYKE